MVWVTNCRKETQIIELFFNYGFQIVIDWPEIYKHANRHPIEIDVQIIPAKWNPIYPLGVRGRDAIR